MLDADLKEKIIKILKNSEKPLSKSQIAKSLGVTPSTASKYVDILQAEGKVTVDYYGNINLVRLAEGEKHEEGRD